MVLLLTLTRVSIGMENSKPSQPTQAKRYRITRERRGNRQNPPVGFDAGCFLPHFTMNPFESYESTSSQPH